MFLYISNPVRRASSIEMEISKEVRLFIKNYYVCVNLLAYAIIWSHFFPYSFFFLVTFIQKALKTNEDDVICLSSQEMSTILFILYL